MSYCHHTSHCYVNCCHHMSFHYCMSYESYYHCYKKSYENWYYCLMKSCDLSMKKSYVYYSDGCTKYLNFHCCYERYSHCQSYLTKSYGSPKKSPYYGVPLHYYWCDCCLMNAQQYPKGETQKCQCHLCALQLREPKSPHAMVCYPPEFHDVREAIQEYGYSE